MSAAPQLLSVRPEMPADDPIDVRELIRAKKLQPHQLEAWVERLCVAKQEVMIARLGRARMNQGQVAEAVGRGTSWASKVKKTDAKDSASIDLFACGMGLSPDDVVKLAISSINAEINAGMWSLPERIEGQEEE